MLELTASERTILAALLGGSHPALEVLRQQLSLASVTEREHSGVGCFTHFAVPESAPRLPVRHWVVSDVDLQLDGVEHGGGALLFVIDGVISMLEVYTYGSEDWPDVPAGLRTRYTTRSNITDGGYSAEPVAQRDEHWLAEEYAAAERRAAAG